MCSLENHFLLYFLLGGPCQLPRTACGYAAHRRELPALQLPRSACGYAARCRELPTLQIFVALLPRGALPASPVSVRPCRPPPGTPCLDFSSKRKIYLYIFFHISIYISVYIYIYPFSTLAVSFLRSLLSELRQTSQATRKLAGVAREHLSPCFSSHAVSFQPSC